MDVQIDQQEAVCFTDAKHILQELNLFLLLVFKKIRPHNTNTLTKPCEHSDDAYNRASDDTDNHHYAQLTDYVVTVLLKQVCCNIPTIFFIHDMSQIWV